MEEKMRRLSTLALALALLVGTAWAMNAHYSSGAAGLAVSDVNLNTPFINSHSGGDSVAFKAWVVQIRNRGANPISFDMDGVATTAADTWIPAGATQIITFDPSRSGGDGFTAIGLICGAGLTATADVDAWR
jgi:hypothetical protein